MTSFWTEHHNAESAPVASPRAVKLREWHCRREYARTYVNQRSPAEVDTQRNSMPERHESTPATLNTNEKARKYHFFPRKSIFELRNNSTLF